MRNNIQQQIIEELEIRSLRYRLLEKKLIRNISIWEKHYKNNSTTELGAYILMKKIRVMKGNLHDAQQAMIDLEWNKQIYLNLNM